MKKRDRKKRLRKRLERISQAGKGKPEPAPPATEPAELGIDVIGPCEMVIFPSVCQTDPEP